MLTQLNIKEIHYDMWPIKYFFGSFSIALFFLYHRCKWGICCFAHLSFSFQRRKNKNLRFILLTIISDLNDYFKFEELFNTCFICMIFYVFRLFHKIHKYTRGWRSNTTNLAILWNICYYWIWVDIYSYIFHTIISVMLSDQN